MELISILREGSFAADHAVSALSLFSPHASRLNAGNGDRKWETLPRESAIRDKTADPGQRGGGKEKRERERETQEELRPRSARGQHESIITRLLLC